MSFRYFAVLMKRRHHFVPQFYLRAFASARRRIHVLNLEREQVFPHASLRHQCYKHRFHGNTDELEDTLAAFEDKVAPSIAAVIAARQLPPRNATTFLDVLSFLSLQLLRTSSVATNLRDSSLLFADEAFDSRPPPGFVLDEHRALRISLSGYSSALQSLRDLTPHLFVAPPGMEFITSDNPVFRYNQYCEGTTRQGVTGNAARGLQVFLPLSPALVFVLYDQAVYKVGSRGDSAASVVSISDVNALNLTQLVSASANVFFSKSGTRNGLLEACGKATRCKAASGSRLVTADEVGDGGGVLLHEYDLMPLLRLQLSVMAFRRNARRAAADQRARLYRYPLSTIFPDDGGDRGVMRQRVFETRPGSTPRGQTGE